MRTIITALIVSTIALHVSSANTNSVLYTGTL